MDNSSTTCRACSENDLKHIFDLGMMPLANALLTEEDLQKPEPKYPLCLVFCPNCTLVQITKTVPPEIMFREYSYFSSFSESFLQHSRDLVSLVYRLRHLNQDSLVVEIASNDGYLLQYYRELGLSVLGIEPALNVAKFAREYRSIDTIAEFFDKELACRLVKQEKKADVIHANNVLGHVADLNSFVEGINLLLKPDGIAVLEVQYVKELFERCEFDTIYHEHLSCFSLTALEHLFGRHNLVIVDAHPVPVHGGSLRFYVMKSDSSKLLPRSYSFHALMQKERDWKVGTIDTYSEFGERVHCQADWLFKHLSRLKKEGKRIAAYGAAAKGTILLNFAGINADIIDYVVDRSPYKQGLYMPGVHLPIYSPSKLLEDQPDYVLLLTWNFATEIMKQQQEYRDRGGRFILPVESL